MCEAGTDPSRRILLLLLLWYSSCCTNTKQGQDRGKWEPPVVCMWCYLCTYVIFAGGGERRRDGAISSRPADSTMHHTTGWRAFCMLVAAKVPDISWTDSVRCFRTLLWWVRKRLLSCKYLQVVRWLWWWDRCMMRTAAVHRRPASGCVRVWGILIIICVRYKQSLLLYLLHEVLFCVVCRLYICRLVVQHGMLHLHLYIAALWCCTARKEIEQKLCVGCWTRHVVLLAFCLLHIFHDVRSYTVLFQVVTI